MGFFDFFKKKDDLTKEMESNRNSKAAEHNMPAPASMGTSGMMTVQDVFTISGRGCVATGQIEAGSFSVGDTVEICHADGSVVSSRIDGIEAFRKLFTTANVGDNVGILLKGADKSTVRAGDVIRGI